jgi:archaellum component FlaG (FlaF/FlaG flagellin family)
MRKIMTILLLVTLMSCGSYTMSTFYVKNTSNKSVSFDTSVLKFSQNVPYNVKQSFTVRPNDSVLTRRASMRNDLGPER